MLLEEKRSWREYFAPGLVIFLGVVAVIAFGLVVVTRGDDPQPSNTTPVLGGLGEPTAAQVPIPLPSASPSISPVPVDSIAIERSAVPDRVDLSAEGTIDWVHWGEQGTYTLERNANGGFAILEGTPDPSRVRHTASPEAFSWTGGHPLATAKGVTSGVRSCDAGSGFTLSAPAGTRDTTLRLYVGMIAGRGSLEIRLSTGGKVVTDTWEQTGESMATAAYTVSYTSSGTGKISIKWITDESFDEDCGGVTLQAATLS
ncbi:hypothetical protein FB565_008993 [Actinoplanes lutulentus]|uniref:Uncharacterized protein n=1 Tax=Actinoplanes lutulentus TaxID=1287878 RepID=A0A327ZB46_9ACTN|nr:hypothetical protein [Actinoplanes lutulentus]MBB2949188.1 hypothetical protein [Actinoplanes lutulentus]RAK34672.1 hypothetical protein B0I29_111274 [Actinoplanes lutulentus]